MKNQFFALMAAAVMLMSSCTKEGGLLGRRGGETTVTFAIGLEGGVATRADVTTNGTGVLCDKLVYEVYDAEGKKIETLSKTVTAFQNGLTETVTFSLAKGQTYSFAFWAQSSKCDAYNTTDLTSIKVNYDNVDSNVENRDAFFGNTDPVMVTGNFTQTVKLKRPFAQLNLAVSDIEAAADAGIKVTGIEVLVGNVATVLNARTGEVSGEKTNVTFKNAGILYQYPAENADPDAPEVNTENSYLNLKGSVTVDGKEQNVFPWMGMNYILVNDATTGDTSANTDVVFTLATNKNPITFDSPSTTVQRNWRTNIIAKLTSTGTFNIVIDPIFDGENNGTLDQDNSDLDVTTYSVMNTETGAMFTNIAQAVEAAEEGDVISVAAGEYDLSDGGLLVKSGNGRFELNKAIVIEGVSAEDVVLNGAILLKNGTLKNVTINANETTGDCLISGAFNGDCTLEGVVINCPAEGTVNAFKEYSGWGDGKAYNLTFKNCIFNTNGQRPLQFDIMNVTVEGCTFNNPYRYCVQLGEYARGCNLTFKNNKVVNYGSSNKAFYTHVQICDMDTNDPATDNSRSNTVVLQGNTQDGSVQDKWVDFYVENPNSNVVITITDGVVYKNKAYELSNANGLRWFAGQVNSKVNFSNKTVLLTNDIDLESKEWTPINGWNGILNGTVIDGQEHTISNMYVLGSETQTSCGFFSNNASSLTIKDLTFDKAKVYDNGRKNGYGSERHYAGVVMAKTYSNVEITNVHVTNSVVVNNWQLGGLVGFAETNVPVFTDCTISDSFVGGEKATAGTFFGLGVVDITATGCKAANVDLYTDGLTWDSTQKASGNYLVGHLYGKTLTATGYEETNVNVVSEYPAGL